MAAVNILGAGPHGQQLAAMFDDAVLFDDWLPGYRPLVDACGPWVVGAVWPQVRRKIAETRSDVAHLDGSIVFPGARIGIGCGIGVHTHVMFNAVVSHGCSLGDYVTVCAGAVLAGEVDVGDGVFIGANATVLHGGIRIGDGATVGAGCVVTRDVGAGATVAGVPGKVLR